MSLRLASLAAILLLCAVPCLADDADSLAPDSVELQREATDVEVTPTAPEPKAEDLVFPLDFARSLEIPTTRFESCGPFPCSSQIGCRNNCLANNCATYFPFCFSVGYCFCDLR